MAKRRRRRARRFARSRSYRPAKRTRRRKGSSTNPMKILLPAVAYGAARQSLVNLAQPLTSKVPLGQYADEAVLGVGGWYLAKKGRGMVKQFGLAMLIVEGASLGSGLIGGGGGAASANPGGWV